MGFLGWFWWDFEGIFGGDFLGGFPEIFGIIEGIWGHFLVDL